MLVLNLLLFVLGFLFLGIGAEGFIRGGSGIAKRFKISEYVIGATVVALGTSLPEAFVSSYASFVGKSEISISNVIGSNIFNLTMVLGFCAVIRPILIKRDVFAKDAPPLLASVLLLFLVGFDGLISRFDGFLFLLLFLAFLYWILIEKEEPDSEFVKLSPPSLLLSLVSLLVGVVSLFFGSKWVVGSGVKIAHSVGISEWVIGASAIAAGTSLPEFVTSLVAIFRGRRALAVGNVIGSNILNIFWVLGMASAISPIKVEKVTLLFDLPFLFVLSLIMVFIIFEKKISRESGFTLLIVFIGYMGALLKSHKP